MIDQQWTANQVDQLMGRLCRNAGLAKLLEALRADTASFDEVASLIEMEPVIAAKVYALSHLTTQDRWHVPTLSRAVQLLGLRNVYAVVVTLAMIQELQPAHENDKQEQALWQWLIGTTVAGRWFLPQVEAAGKVTGQELTNSEATVCSTLGNLGPLILFYGAEDLYRPLMGEPFRPVGLCARERHALGVGHTDVTRWALREMQCPESIVRYFECAECHTLEHQQQFCLMRRAIETLGAILAGMNTQDDETWILEAFDRLGLYHDEFDSLVDYLSGQVHDLSKDMGFKVHRDQQQYRQQLMVAASNSIDHLLYDNLSLSASLGVVEQHKLSSERYAQSATEQAKHDELTRAMNRRGLERLIEQRSGPNGPGVDLVLIDVDKFKNINDTLGHHVGDQVLEALVDAIRTGLRPQDVVARIGGDEFVILMERIENQSIEDWRESLCNMLQTICQQRQIPIPAFSLGVVQTSWPDLYQQWDHLLQAVDALMYENKKQRRTAC